MNPASILLVLQGLQIALNAAPDVIAIINGAKQVFSGLFEAGKITKEQQAALHGEVDSICAMAKAGLLPPEFQVEPDPVSTTPTGTTTTATKVTA